MALTQISTKGLKDGTILNADVNASAAIAGTKISSDFGSQNITTTGRLLLGTTTEGHTDADDLTIATSSGYAGITLRSPSDQGGAIYFSDATSGAGEYDGQILYSQSSRTMQLITANNPRLTLDSSGNLLSGTTSSSLLSNFNTNAGGLVLDDIGSGATAFLATHGDKQIFLGNDTSANYLWGYSNHNLLFGTNNQTRLTITSDGNVGIGGATSVGTKLHIENASGDAHIRLRGSANYGILFTRHSDAALTGYVGSGNAVNLGGSNVAVSASLSGGDIIFQTNGTAATDEKMRIKSNGAISFTSQNATGWQLNAGDDSASYSAIDNHFPTTNRTLYFNAETTHRSVAFWNKNGSDGYGFGLDNSGNFKVVAGTTAHLKVTGSNGLVGIGTTAPSELLTINGADKSALIRTSNAVGTAKLKFEADGTNYAGIGLENTSLVFRCSNSSTPTTRFTIFADGSITSNGDIRVDRGTAGPDGLLGQAYSGYFGLKHADQTINQEYMIINNDSHTFISCSANAGVYIRPSANSVTHETFFGVNDTQFKTNVFMNSHYITRNSWEYGFLVGAQNNLGASDQFTNPIFSIGTSHLPTSTALVDMYGIGYTHGNASFTPSGAGWGMYVAADGDSRVYLDGSYGNIHLQDLQGSLIFANDGWSGDKSTGKIQTYFGHMYLQNASNSGAWAFRLPNGTEPYKINANGTVTTSDRRLKKDITTITGAVDTVKQLIGRSFTWKEGDTKSFGIIAQEVETILPEIISTQTVIEGEENDDPYKMVNYAAFTGHFIEAIKELATKVEALETEVATLKAS